jgi:tripartite-type tricarboxylate transporter receptor subunit TctC
MNALRVFAGVALLAVAPTLFAQPFPSRAIRVVVPYPAGGVVDVVARAITERMASSMGHSVVVENKPGGYTVVATEQVLAAAPDGYTWLIAPPAFAANVTLLDNLRYDPMRDFMPVARFALSADYFLVPSALPVADVAEYVKLVKSQPGKHNFGAPGIGGAAHLAFEQFKRAANLDIVTVPYQGAPPVIPDLASGQLSSAFLPAVVSIPQVKGGRVKPLAVISQKRQKALPDVPTIGEAGYPGVQATLWIGIVVAGKTPPEIVRRIADEVEKALKAPEVIARLDTLGAEPAYLGPEAFGEFIRQEIIMNGRVIRDAGIKVQ